MVDSVSNFASQAFGNAQRKPSAQGNANSLTNIKSNKAAKEAILQQIEQTASQGRSLMERSSSTAALSANPAPDSNLPRGSLVDFVV